MIAARIMEAGQTRRRPRPSVRTTTTMARTMKTTAQRIET